MTDSQLSLTSISSFTVSLVQMNEMLTALALVVSSLSGLIVVYNKFKAVKRCEDCKLHNKNL